MEWWCGDVDAYDDTFDIGLATHLCGEATDLAQMKCIQHRAIFILTPCCVGKIKHLLTENKHTSNNAVTSCPLVGTPLAGIPHLSYPRSVWLRGQVNMDSYLQVPCLHPVY